jgi:hypothetical protein
MPLKGEANRAYMREYMRRRRAAQAAGGTSAVKPAVKPRLKWRIADKEEIAANDGEGFLMADMGDCCLYIYQQPEDFFWQVVDGDGIWEGQEPSIIAAMTEAGDLRKRPRQEFGLAAPHPLRRMPRPACGVGCPCVLFAAPWVTAPPASASPRPAGAYPWARHALHQPSSSRSSAGSWGKARSARSVWWFNAV